MTIEQLEKELNAGKLNSIYLLYGEENYLLENSYKKIKKNFGQRIAGINYIVIDETNLEEIIPNIETPAFGFPKKLIVLRHTGLFKKEGKKKNTKIVEMQEKLLAYFQANQDVLESIVLVILEEEMDSKTKLVKWIEEQGVVCQFEKQKPAQIAKRLKAICKAYGVEVEDATLLYFIECCGTNMQELINEIRKLIEYTGKRRNCYQTSHRFIIIQTN